MTRPERPQCPSVREDRYRAQWQCTRPEGHKGRHQARTAEGRLVGSWPR